MDDTRYINGIDYERGEYWVLPSKDGRGVSREQAEAFIREQRDYPWRLAEASRRLFVMITSKDNIPHPP